MFIVSKFYNGVEMLLKTRINFLPLLFFFPFVCVAAIFNDNAKLESLYTSSWHVAQTRLNLDVEHAWQVDLEALLRLGTPVRFSLSGQTERFDLVKENNNIHLIKFAPGVAPIVRTARLNRNTVAPDDKLLVLKSNSHFSVFHNDRLISAFPASFEQYHKGEWAFAEKAPENIPEIVYQRVIQPYFIDDFTYGEGEMGQWKMLSGAWKVRSLENPIRSANAFSILGTTEKNIDLQNFGVTDLAIVDNGNWFWRNYTANVSAFPMDRQPFGVRIYSSETSGRGYYLLWTPVDSKDEGRDASEGNFVLLRRDATGSETRLSEIPFNLGKEQWLNLQLSCYEGDLTVAIDGVVVSRVKDPNPLPSGGFSLVSSGTSGVVFDDAKVEGQNFYEVENQKSSNFAGMTVADSHLTLFLDSASPQPFSLTAREQGLDKISLQVGVERGLYSVKLYENFGGNSRLLADAKLEKFPRVMELLLSGDDVTVIADGIMSCYATTSLRIAGRSSFVSGAVVPVAKLESFTEMPMVSDLVKVFAHEKTMESWSGEASEWEQSETVANETWYRTEFWQDVYANMNITLNSDGKVQNSGLLLYAYNENDAITIRNGIMVFGSTESGFKVVAGNHREEPMILWDSSEVPKNIGISRRYGKLMFFINDRIVYHVPLSDEMKGLVRVGRSGIGAPETWISNISVFADGVNSYSFKQAPDGWLIASGEWMVTNRWDCDDRWTFFSGAAKTRNTSALIWYKKGLEGDFTIEFFVAPKMISGRGGSYSYVRDFNVVICADDQDLLSGYSCLFGGRANSGSYIYKGTSAVISNTNIKIPAGSTLHRQWLPIKVRRYGNVISFWADGNFVGSYEDSEPLDGNKFGLWTWDNGIMIAKMRISASGYSKDIPEGTTVDDEILTIYNRSLRNSLRRNLRDRDTQ